MPTLRLLQPIGVLDLLTNAGLAPSKSEARRLVQQGGVKLNGERIDDFKFTIPSGGERVLQVGRRKFLKLIE